MKAADQLRKSIFDTRFDTKRIFVTTRTRFSLRSYKDKNGESLIYLDIADSKDRIRLNTEIYIPAECWDNKKQRVKNHARKDELNLVLENIEAKLTTIKTSFMLRELFLDARTMVKNFQSATPEFDFISFFRHHLELQDFKPQTKKNHNTVLKKLEAFSLELPFHKITKEFLQKYRRHYAHNSLVTYHSDLKCIKKFLKIAQKENIRLNIDLDDIKVNVDTNKTVYLLPAEMKKLVDYYYNDFINPSHILPLGYFLFSCYTGMRISDIQALNRNDILADQFTFVSKKTDIQQHMRLNAAARKMVEYYPDLFVERLVDQKINFHLKSVARACKIKKTISMHVGRHTFATTFIRNKGDIFRLQHLLGHANIRHTSKYIHLVNSEVLDDVDLISY